MRVGLLGGTFDPPHLGHLVVAEHARILLRLDEVRLLVAGAPWMKDTAASVADRVAMAELAVADHDRLRVDARETRHDGPTYTADTLEALIAEEPECEWVFLLGTDAAAKLADWIRIDAALALATFVEVTRPGHRLDNAAGVLEGLERLEVPAVGISSTDLRARFAAGQPSRYLLPDTVRAYIVEHDLYGA